MWFGRSGADFRGWFALTDTNGALVRDVSVASFTASVRIPSDTSGSTFAVTQSGKRGFYRFDIPGSFVSSVGIGGYGVVVEVDSAAPAVADAFSRVFQVSSDDLTSLTGSVWSSSAGQFASTGSFGFLLNQLHYVSESVKSTQATLSLVSSSVDLVKNVSLGRWRIDTAAHQLLLYKEDNSTVVAQFNLYDVTGTLSHLSPYDRQRV